MSSLEHSRRAMPHLQPVQSQLNRQENLVLTVVEPAFVLSVAEEHFPARCVAAVFGKAAVYAAEAGGRAVPAVMEAERMPPAEKPADTAAEQAACPVKYAAEREENPAVSATARALCRMTVYCAMEERLVQLAAVQESRNKGLYSLRWYRYQKIREQQGGE